MSEYKPTTRQIKEVYSAAEGNCVGILALRTAEFDRWLASVKAEAWDEGAESAYYDPEYRDQVNYPDNPYRKER